MISPTELLAMIGGASLLGGGIWGYQTLATRAALGEAREVESTIRAGSDEMEKMQTYGELEKNRQNAIKIVGEMIEDLSMALQHDQNPCLGPWHLQSVISSLGAIKKQMMRTSSQVGGSLTATEPEVAAAVCELIGMRQLPLGYQMPTSSAELLFVACRLYRLVSVAMRNNALGPAKSSYNLAYRD